MEIDWKTLNYDEFVDIIGDEAQAFAFCWEFGLIDHVRACDCGREMAPQKDQQQKYGLRFACTASRLICNRKASILKGSFFARACLPVSTSLKCIAGYAVEANNAQLGFYAGIRSPNSIVNWQNYFRDACSEFIAARRGLKIGGAGLTVEVDESLLFKRKNHAGRLLANEASGIWVVGGICRETNDCFVVPVTSRDAETLRAIIEENVEPGTQVMTDCWRGYSGLGECGFRHRSVNHSINFIDPDDRSVHTQKIERMWKSLKKAVPKECNSQLRWSYIQEFLFKQRYGWYKLTIGERIHLILTQLKAVRFC
jgi:transposase-like protein